MRRLLLAGACVAAPLLAILASPTATLAQGLVFSEPAIYDAAPKEPLLRAALPVSVDLSPFAPPPGDQQFQTSCVGWAVAYAANTALQAQMTGQKVLDPARAFSPSYIYNQSILDQIKAGPKPNTCYLGMSIEAGLDLLRDSGSLPMASFAYDPFKCTRSPTPAETAEARRYKIAGWTVAETRDDIRQALSQGRPVVIGMRTTEVFKSWKTPATYRSDTDELRGSHAMAIMGYDDERDDGKGAFLVLNSWGLYWGDRGYAWIGYETVERLANIQGRLRAYVIDPGNEALAPPPTLLPSLQPAVLARVDPVPSPQVPTTVRPLPAEPPKPTTEAQLREAAAGLRCGVASITQHANGNLSVTGFANTAERLALLNASKKIAPDATVEVQDAPWPQCETRMRLRNVFDPSISARVEAENGPVSPNADVVRLAEGQYFNIRGVTETATPHLTLIYVQADGSAVVLFAGLAPRDASGRLVVHMGERVPGQPRFKVGGPLGAEMVVALASDRPVFDEGLNTGSTEREFLDLLTRKIGELKAAGHPLRAGYTRIETFKPVG